MRQQNSARNRKANTPPAVIFLLAAIALLLAALVVVLVTRGGSAQPQAATAAGGRVEPATPQPVDTTRVLQTYSPGAKYLSHVKAVLNAKASNKDWGVVEDMSFSYGAEAQIERMIESNDGTTIVLTQQFRESRCIAAFTHIDGIRLELGAPAQTLLELAGGALEMPPGWSEVVAQSANTVLASPLARPFLDQLTKDPDAKVKAYVDSLQGKKVRIHYVNGKGVTGIEPLGCTLSDGERDFIQGSSFISDAYVFPDPAAKKWEVDAAELLPIIDPSLRSTLVGSVKVSRGPDGGPADAPVAIIKLDGSSQIDLNSTKDGNQTEAKWIPTGELHFSFKDHIVTSGQLGGEFLIVSHSTNHILFEARFATRPSYDVSYDCTVVK